MALAAQLERILTAVFKSAGAFIGTFRSIRHARLRRVDPTAPLKLDCGRLPESYGKTQFAVLVVDPHRVHAYWEITPERLEQAEKQMGAVRSAVQPVLRFDEVVSERTATTIETKWFDIPVGLDARNWFVNLWSSDKVYNVTLGLKSKDRFVSLVRSNRIRTPRTSPVARQEPLDSQAACTEHGTQVEAIERHPEFARPAAHSGRNGMRQSTLSALTAARPTATEALTQKLAEFRAIREAASKQLGVSLPMFADPPETAEAKQDLHAPIERDSEPLPEPPLQRVEITDVAEERFQAGVSSLLLRVGHPESH
jgi:hypothetical protein